MSTPYMEFFQDNHKIQVWLEVRDGEYILKEVSDVKKKIFTREQYARS